MKPVSLDVIRVKIPCSVPWDSMPGDARVRFCDQCHLHVHNVSEMNEREIVALVQGATGRLCVSYFERPDGTILTDKCPQALRPIRNGYRWLATWAGLAITLASGCKPPLTQSQPSTQAERSTHAAASRNVPASQLSKEQLNQIRQLGYISGNAAPTPKPASSSKSRALGISYLSN